MHRWRGWQQVAGPIGIILAVVLAIASVTFRGLNAQSAADHTLLAAAADAVGRNAEATLPRPDDGIARQIQLGLVELDRYLKQGDRPAIERALFRFSGATRRRPQWAWPEYAMAHAFLLLHDQRAPLLHSEGIRESEPYLAAMWRHLLESLRREPDFARARQLLAELSYPSGDRELRPGTHEALALEVGRTDAHPDALLVWSRHQRALRAYDIALAVLDRAAAAGADRSVVGLERARTLTALGRDEEATAAYWNGLEQLTAKGRALYRQDLGWLLTPDSLAAFDSLHDSAVTGWMERFWAERDAAATLPTGARLTEQLRRWVYAHAHFRVASPWDHQLYTRVDIGFDGRVACISSDPGFYAMLPVKPPMLPGDLRHLEPLLDHRGQIYLRHGAPVEIISQTPQGDLEGNEPIQWVARNSFGGLPLEVSAAQTSIWIYRIEGAWRVLSFRGSMALGAHAPTTLSSYTYGDASFWSGVTSVTGEYAGLAARLSQLESRLFEPLYPPSCEKEYVQAVRQSRQDANLSIVTDTRTPPLRRHWLSELRSFGVGSSHDESGRALVTFALPIRDLVADTLASGDMVWPLDFRIVAYRPSDGRRVDMDSTRRFNATGTPANGFLSGHFELPLDDGTWQLAILVRQNGDSTAGAYTLRRGLVVGGSTPLSLGDIVTGREGQPAWRAPDGPFPVNTLGTWVAGGTVELWYEVRGMREGDTYRTTIQVIPRDRRQGQPVRVATDDQATGPVTRMRKAIGLDRLEPGVYQLVVTVERGGTTAVREQEIVVVDGS